MRHQKALDEYVCDLRHDKKGAGVVSSVQPAGSEAAIEVHRYLASVLGRTPDMPFADRNLRGRTSVIAKQHIQRNTIAAAVSSVVTGRARRARDFVRTTAIGIAAAGMPAGCTRLTILWT